MKCKSLYRTAMHCGGLKECLETEKDINEAKFIEYYLSGKYEYYCYDNRIKAHRYLLKNMQKDHLKYPCWLHYYGEKPIYIKL